MGPFFLLENGANLLLESGGKILLEFPTKWDKEKKNTDSWQTGSNLTALWTFITPPVTPY